MDADATRSPHYVVELTGQPGTVSVWGLGEFRRLQAAGEIARVASCTPIETDPTEEARDGR